MRKVKLVLLEKKLLRQQSWYPSNSIFTRDGCVLVRAEGAGVPEKNYFSSNGGVTWQEMEPLLGNFSYIQLRDGSLLGIGCQNEIQTKIPRRQAYKPYIMAVRRAASLQAFVAGEYEDDFVKVDVPELAGACGDDHNFFCGTVDHGIVEMPDGSILVNMYGHFRADKTPVTVFPTESFQYRTWVVISRDGGKSFEYLSTVADVQTWPVGEKAEGYCEADMRRLQNGTLLCVMRTGGSVHEGNDGYTPLFSCVSQDDGVTWGKPVKMHGYGVYPKLVQTANGAVVAAAGRDGMYLVASADGGNTWQQPLIISSSGGKWGWSPSGYGCLGEVRPNELLLIYDDVDSGSVFPEPGTPEHSTFVIGSRNKVYCQRVRVDIVED